MNDRGLDRPADAGEIAKATGRTARAIQLRAQKDGWSFTEKKVRGGRKKFFELSALPTEIQAAVLLHRDSNESPAAGTSPPGGGGSRETGRGVSPAAGSTSRPSPAVFDIEGAQEAFQRATQNARDQAVERLQKVKYVYALADAGMTKREACKQAGVPFQTFYRWEGMIRGADSQHWLELLCPDDKGGNNKAEFSPEAQKFLKAHWLTRKQPSMQSSINRTRELAAENGWKMPSDRALNRFLNAIPEEVRRLAREGRDITAEMLVSQRRTVMSYGPGELVNGDGLKFDELWIKFEDGEIVNGATCWVNQDIRTRRLINYELGKTENTDVFRLSIYGLTAICLPNYYFVDNTTAAANKVMTAGAKSRNRYKIKEEEGVGMLRMLDITPCFTSADKIFGRPGAKPIERAFRDFHKEITTNPKLCDAGYSKKTAVPVALVREVIDHEIARWNARTKRRTEACRGLLSFNEAWEDGARQFPVRQCDERKRRLLLLSRESVKVNQRDGHIRLKAGATSEWGANRYWSEPLSRLRGQNVIAYFDPYDLTKPVHVYNLSGRYLTAAEHIPNEAFMSEEAAREWRKQKARKVKGMKVAAEAEAGMSRQEMQQAYARVSIPGGPETPDTNVRHIGFGRVPDPDADRLVANSDVVPGGEADGDEDFDAFSRAMRNFKPRGGEFD